jgi:hypothetical protein
MTERHLATRAGEEPGRPAATGPAAGPGRQGAPSGAARVAALARRHWLIGLLLLGGLVLRILAQLAYQPALIYVDTLKYLYGASPGADPQGYMLLLRVLVGLGGVGPVAAIQHLAGLGLGAALYTIVLRRGAPRWLAALAAAPVLLDAYQIQIEQTIMPDVWFEVLLVAGLGLLLWREAVSLRLAAAGGLVLGLSALFRQVGEVLIVPAAVYLLACGGGLRWLATRGAALAVAFALPILTYCTVSYASTGHFWLARGQTDIGRLTAAADCATLRLPATLREICPTPAEQRQGPDWLEHSGHSPLAPKQLPAGADRTQLLNQLGGAIVHQQPLRVAGSVARDSLRLFAVTRDPGRWIAPVSRWQFQTYYPTYPPWVSLGPGNTILVGLQPVLYGRFYVHPLHPRYGGPAHVIRPLAAFLRNYQLGGGYTPGPALALLTLAGLAGSLLALIRPGSSPRTRRLALGCLLFTGSAVVLLLASDFYEFSWRYQLPAVVTLPPGGLLGLAALVSRLRDRARPAAPEPG